MAIYFQDGEFNQKRLTILNDERLRLIGEQIEGNQPYRLPFFQIRAKAKNMFEFRAVLNNGKKDDEGRIVFDVDLPTVMNFLTCLEDTIRSKEPCCHLIEMKRMGFDRQTRKPTGYYTVGVVAVGRNKDGVEYVGVQRGNKGSNNYMKVNFFFVEPEAAPLLDASNNLQPLSKVKTSNIIARGMHKLWSYAVMEVAAHNWDYNETQEAYRARRANKNGNHNGGYNNNNYRANNNNANASTNNTDNSADSFSSSFEEDIEF